ncbi:BLUF domain-containing protein [Hymenobacter sediminis]|uniref:BLUF domain-containing protein n=1 Tax=Hymenobacter sediminis TaxID=2218621 RepID=UPI00139048CD|nr:BLUF domain-containing protein [Hymenobacter sediminis]
MEQHLTPSQRQEALLRLAACTADLPLPLLAHRIRKTGGASHTPSASCGPAGDPLQQLVYRSRARHPFAEEQLVSLLEQARTHNEYHGLTGLLFYYQGQFIQFLEGCTPEVEPLYARIQQDPRHGQVTTLYQGTSTQRVFTGWSMGFAEPGAEEFYWLLDYLETQQHRLLLPKIPIPEPDLQRLLAPWVSEA